MYIGIPIPAGVPPPAPITIDTTPLVLDEATRALYSRAIADPDSLTDHERRVITRRPPPEEEDELCRGACGLSMDELIAKAINSKLNDTNDANNDNNRDDNIISLADLPLSELEASILIVGVSGAVQKQGMKFINEIARLSPKDRDLKKRAIEAARANDVQAARKVAVAVQKRWDDVRQAAEEVMNNEDIRNIKAAMKVPWQDHVLGSSSTAGDRFGLVVFCSEKEGEDEQGAGAREGRLASYKSQIETAIYHTLHYATSLVKAETRARFALHWVAVLSTSGDEDRGSDVVDPRTLGSRLRTMLSNSEIPDGFRRDAFLCVDNEAFASRETARPYVWLAEPEPEPVLQHKAGTGAQAALKVDIKHIPTLFARLVQRDLQGEAKQKPYRYTSELSQLHHAVTVSYRKWEGREGDGIWPPPFRIQ
jgi:hypothetical protein